MTIALPERVSSSSRAPSEGTRLSLYFFLSRRARAREAGVAAPTIFAISRRAIFSARGLFAPSAGPLSYFPPGNIAPTRKTIRVGEGVRASEGWSERPSGPGDRGGVRA